MMRSVCKNKSVTSIFSHALNQTLGSPSPPPIPPCFPANNLNLAFNPLIPIKVLDSSTTVTPPDSAGDMKNSGNIDLMSCTESVGNESCDDMMSNLDDLGSFNFRSNSRRGNNNNNNNEDFLLSASSSSPSSSFSSYSSSCCLRRRWEEKKFPPPLTSLSENGRRNFTLQSTRKDGRLEIVRVMIERPEFLCASRDNGRLRLHLVQDVSGDDDDDFDHDYDNRDDDNDDDEKETEEEKIETEKDHLETGEEEGEGKGEEETEEREWRIPAGSGLRRCYDHQRQGAWGPQQHQCVTTV